MVTVIKRAQRRETARVICHNCHSILEYKKDDVKTASQYNHDEYWIKCPVCGVCIDVDYLNVFSWIDPVGYYEDN